MQVAKYQINRVNGMFRFFFILSLFMTSLMSFGQHNPEENGVEASSEEQHADSHGEEGAFNAGETISNTASSAVAAAFSSLLNNPNGKFQLGLDYQQGDSGNDIESLNIDNQVDVSVSTQVSDRVIINGKVGVPVGAQTQSSVVGEVKVEVLLNKPGNFRGVIFNRQNEIQYSTEEEGYTQGVGLSYQVNFNTLSGLLKKISKQNKTKIKTKDIVVNDTIKKVKNGVINFEGN